MIKTVLFPLLFLFFGSTAYSYTINDNDLHLIMPEADTFTLKTDPLLYYAFQNKKFTGICFTTCAVFSNCRGYNGPINVLIGLSVRGSITGIRILNHSENIIQACQITNISFTGRFKNKKISDPFIVHKDIDNITGATITTRKISYIIQQSSLLVYRNYLLPYLKTHKPADTRHNTFLPGFILVCLLLITVTFLLFYYLQQRSLNKYLLLTILSLLLISDCLVITFLYRKLILEKNSISPHIISNSPAVTTPTEIPTGKTNAEDRQQTNENNYSDLILKPKWGIQKIDQNSIREQIRRNNLTDKEAENYERVP